MAETSRAQYVERFLQATLAERRGTGPAAPGTGPRPFVTISRQAGAGGRALAEAMVELFAHEDDDTLFGEWQIFDRELCELAAADPRLHSSLDALVEEEYLTRADEFVRQLLRPAADQDYVMGRVFATVRAIAALGKAIILGRAASEVTRGMPLGCSLRVIAPEPLRVARLAERDGVPERQARDAARRRDAARARLLRRHFHVDIADPERYDATWNTAMASSEEIAAATAALLRRRAATAGAGVEAVRP